MRAPESQSFLRKSAAGFTLPAILVVVAALLILAVGILLVAGIERKTTRSFVDRQRAMLAARAGLDHVKGILNLETSNDDFLVIQSSAITPLTPGYAQPPYLFIARGQAVSGGYSYRYIPLFSSAGSPPDSPLASPDIESLWSQASGMTVDYRTLPYLDKVRTAWLPILDDKNRVVARYAYWVEDLQGKIDGNTAGNIKGTNETHIRAKYPFPVAGLNDQPSSESSPPLDQIALYAVDPTATDQNQRSLGQTIIKNRKLLVSPDSILAASSAVPPLLRLKADTGIGKIGELSDSSFRAAEESITTGIQPYDEQPLVPYVMGIDPAVAGKPKLNLNRLVATGGSAAVEEMAAFINKAFPKFEERKGGFPDNYVKTIAANAIDYADKDDRPTLLDGEYRGIDSYPMTTELALKVSYQNMTIVNGRQFLNFNIRLFAELYNPTNRNVSGSARLSYEVALQAPALGTETAIHSFDSDFLLGNPSYSTHDLEKIGGRYWSHPISVSLRQGEYKCYLFADVTYRIDEGNVAENPVGDTTPFSLDEAKGASGSSLMWNNDVVERQQGVVRQQGFIYSEDKNKIKISGYLVNESDVLTKDHLPGLLYDKPSLSDFYGNTGDPRISHYMNRLRTSPLSQSAYPENASPNRRSVRLNIYNLKISDPKPKVYSRMLPSEWSDGGHDSTVGSWKPGIKDETELIEPKFDFTYEPSTEYTAIQRISNRGYYISETELGNLFDPIMYAPTFGSAAATKTFRADSEMPAGEVSWPLAVSGQGSPLYGGGNTLRIGRPEHPAFNVTRIQENRAIGLLDLFHTGQPLAVDEALRTGPLVHIRGQVNLNTASRDALRAIAAGSLEMDPALAKKTSPNHNLKLIMAPPTEPLKLGAPENDIPAAVTADVIADAIIAGRPYACPSRVALAKRPDGEEVFGNRKIYPDAENVQWSDAAAEEVFSRVYQAAAVRSRNFRVWIIAQSITPSSFSTISPEVLAEVRKVYSVMSDPGVRSSSGGIVPGNSKIKILSANEF